MDLRQVACYVCRNFPLPEADISRLRPCFVACVRITFLSFGDHVHYHTYQLNAENSRNFLFKTFWPNRPGACSDKPCALPSFKTGRRTRKAQWSLYRVSQEECARLREGVPYVKVYRYNPKHLCPKLNGYGDNGQRKVWPSSGSTHCTCQLTALSMLRR